MELEEEELDAGSAPEENFSEESVDFDELISMIHHDPLSGPAYEEADASEGEDEGEALEVEPLAAAPEEQEPEVVAPAALDMSAISQAIADGFRTAKEPPAEAGTKEEQKAPTGPDFGRIQIPEQVIQAMEHDDPAVRAQGYQAFAGGVGNLIYSQAMQQVQQQMQHLTQTMPNVVQEHFAATQRRQHVEQDFYGSYPQLNTPALRPLVMQTAAAVLKETGATGWTDEARDAIAGRVFAMFQGALPQPAAAPTPAPAPPARLSSQRVSTRPSVRPDPGSVGSLFDGLTPVN